MKIRRREFFKSFCRWTAFSGLFATGLKLSHRANDFEQNYAYVWQLDPNKCIQCGNCATSCVLSPSAVKCFHDFSMCGYCDLCSGYLIQDAVNRDTGAENQLCPSGAIKRKFIENPYFEYTIDKSLCLGCGRCVKGCGAFGNGSLLLQVSHDLCKNCNQCSIASQCPAGAFKRVPGNKAYTLKS